MNPTDKSDTSKPLELLGYDANGQPLYGTPANAAPPVQQGSGIYQAVRTVEAPRLVNVSPSAIHSADVPENIDELHNESVRQYPMLNLSEAEYVITSIRRHPIGIIGTIVGSGILVCLIIAGIILYPSVVTATDVNDPPNVGIIALVGIILAAIIAGFAYMNVWIYQANKFFLTNESVIQNIQLSLFSKREQTISLGNVEDASFHQDGVLQSMFDYGSIRLSTEGDETTYRMSYVAAPRQQVAKLTNAVEDFKNGRRIDS